MSYFTDEQRAAIMSTARANIAAPRFPPRDNVIPFVPPRAAEPEPAPARSAMTNSVIARLIEEAANGTRAALCEQREEIVGYFNDLLPEILGAFKQGLSGEGGDIQHLDVQLAALRAELDQVRGQVEAQNGTIDQLQTDLAALRDEIADIGAQVEKQATFSREQFERINREISTAKIARLHRLGSDVA